MCNGSQVSVSLTATWHVKSTLLGATTINGAKASTAALGGSAARASRAAAGAIAWGSGVDLDLVN